MEGGTPLAAVADGSLTADEVSALLRDLVLRGACARLRGSDGADLGAHYLAARTGNEVARHQEGPTVREVRPRPATLLQWGKDGSEARTFAEFELAESRVRKALMSQEESATDSVRGNVSEDLTDWVKEDSEGGADEPLAVTANDEVVPPPTVPPEDVADDEFVEASVEVQVPPTSRFSSSGWLLIAILLCGLGFLGHQLWSMDRLALYRVILTTLLPK